MEAEQEELEIIKKLHTTTQIHKNILEQMEKLNIDSVMKGDYGFLGDNKSFNYSDNDNNNNKSDMINGENSENNNNINNQSKQSNQSISLSSKK